MWLVDKCLFGCGPSALITMRALAISSLVTRVNLALRAVTALLCVLEMGFTKLRGGAPYPGLERVVRLMNRAQPSKAPAMVTPWRARPPGDTVATMQWRQEISAASGAEAGRAESGVRIDPEGQ